jgi:hypothetical protein
MMAASVEVMERSGEVLHAREGVRRAPQHQKGDEKKPTW